MACRPEHSLIERNQVYPPTDLSVVKKLPFAIAFSHPNLPASGPHSQKKEPIGKNGKYTADI